MRYWYDTATGNLKTEAPATLRAVGHSGYALTPDLATLPGPVSCCRWDGAQVVVDAALLAAAKVLLRNRIEEKAFTALQESVLTTPWGDLRVRKDDIDAYQMIGFSAIYAIQTSGTFSVQIRKADDTLATLNATQFMRLLALIGDRMASKLTLRDTRLNQLAAATADDLKGFVP